MSIKVRFYTRSCYGRVLYCPVDDLARLLCFMGKKKTLSVRDIEKIREYGIEVEMEDGRPTKPS